MTSELSDIKELAAMPPALRALLEAELKIGNRVAEINYGFPAPPVGFCVLLAQPISTRPKDADDGLCFDEWPNWKGYNGYTDGRGHYFLLNPPLLPPPDPEPHWDENGAYIGNAAQPGALPETRTEERKEILADHDDTLLERFRQSMKMDHDKWRDGTGYDLDALRAMPEDRRDVIQSELLARGIRDWRDVEALALLDSPAAHASLAAALEDGDAEIRQAVTRHAPDLVPLDQRVASLVAALETATFLNGLSEALDDAVDLHPHQVMEALWRGIQDREGEVAVHFAALLAYLHGKADAPFDLARRPFFLTFNTEDSQERAAAIEKLRREIDPGDRK